MKDLSKSSFIFDLIEKYELSNLSQEPNNLSDEVFYSFCEDYKKTSVDRDVALFHYLKSNPNLFRVHLPDSKWVFAIASNLIWYYDELIINDPILQIINSDKNDAFKKYQLQKLVPLLKERKDSIEGGYFLFSGDNIMPNKTGLFDNDSKLLVSIPEVLNAFEQSSLMIKKPSRLNDNPNDDLTQLEIIYEGLWGEIRQMGQYIPPHIFNSDKLTNGVFYDFMTPYQQLTKEELFAYGKQDLLELVKNEYCKDISVVLETITNAQRLQTPVLFYRNVDYLTAKNYAVSNGRSTDIVADTSVYDCIIPYVKGIPAKRLFDVRNQKPEAFNDFRAFLFELVLKTMKSTDNNAEFKFKIDSEIASLMRKLNVEMESARKKFNAHGIVSPLFLMTAALTLYSSGIDYLKLLSTFMGSGGLIQTYKTWSDVSADRSKAVLNPVYFLWKVQQK